MKIYPEDTYQFCTKKKKKKQGVGRKTFRTSCEAKCLKVSEEAVLLISICFLEEDKLACVGS